MKRIVARFAIARTTFIDEGGRAPGELPAFARDRDALVALYRGMVLTRHFDEKAIALQRTGALGTYASSLGQEAVAVGVAAAMRPEDVLLPSFREHGAQLWRGVTIEELLLFWGGHERGNDFAGPRHDFPVCIPVASHLPHAAGVGLALALGGEPRCAVVVAGDGATSKGDFYEALNVMGVWRLPVVVVVANNAWAISVPREAQTAAATLAQKAIAAGMPAEQVDGNDVVAVRSVVEDHLARARGGEGPGLVECLTYRLGDHTTADDAGRYRSSEAVSARWRGEPVARLREHLVARHGWRREDEEGLRAECRERVETATHAYLASPPEPPTAMFDYLFAELPEALADQRAQVLGSDADG